MGSIDILTKLYFEIYEHKIPFHLFVFNFFYHCYIVFSIHICHLLGYMFMPKYFIIFDAFINEIFFLISFPDSILMYQNTIDFFLH